MLSEVAIEYKLALFKARTETKIFEFDGKLRLLIEIGEMRPASE